MSRHLFEQLVPHGHDLWDALPGHDADSILATVQSLQLYVTSMSQANASQIKDGMFIPGTARLLYSMKPDLEWQPNWQSIVFDLGTNTVCAYTNQGMVTVMPIDVTHQITLSFMDNIAILPQQWEHVVRNSL